jgi:hypothetical protein
MIKHLPTDLTRYAHYGHRDAAARAANAAHQKAFRDRRRAERQLENLLSPDQAAERAALLARLAEIEDEARAAGARVHG